MNSETINLITVFKAVIDVLEEKNKSENACVTSKDKPVEMLTIKECMALAPGLSYNTMYQLIVQKKIKAIHAGKGKRGRYLVNKDSFLAYLNCEDC